MSWPPDIWLVLTIIAALVFNFVDGYVASSSLVATLIASQSLSQRNALALASVGEFVGPLVFGVAVAGTVGRDFVNTDNMLISTVLAMLVGAVVWLLITYRLGLPVSPSHSLVGGILGAAMAASGWQVVRTAGLTKIIVSLLLAPIIGLIAGWFIMLLILFLSRRASPRINGAFKRAQLVTSTLLAISQGSNDAQKTMGVMVMALVISGSQAEFHVPPWVLLVCALSIALGVAFGGTRTIRTLASKFYRVRPVHGFATQTAAAVVVAVAALIGAPVSAGQVVSSALVGVGSAERMSKVRWNVAASIAMAWLLTIPASAIAGALICRVIIWLI